MAISVSVTCVNTGLVISSLFAPATLATSMSLSGTMSAPIFSCHSDTKYCAASITDSLMIVSFSLFDSDI